MIQKQSKNRRGVTANLNEGQERSGRSGVQQRAYWLVLDVKRIVRIKFVFPNTMVTSDFTVTFCDIWQEICDEMTGTLAQTLLSFSSRKRARPHVPEDHKFVTNINMVIVTHPPSSPD
jgi:hypothetical protein